MVQSEPQHVKLKRRVDALLDELGYVWEHEYPFCEERNWRADWALIERRLKIGGHWSIEVEPVGILLEYEGGGFHGRHLTVQGARADMVKYATAALMGWAVLRFDNTLITNGTLERWLTHWPDVWVQPTWWNEPKRKKKK